MLRYILCDLSLFNDASESDVSRGGLLWFLESLTQWDQLLLKKYSSIPKLYKSGVKYAQPAQMRTGEVPELARIVASLQKHGERDANVWADIEELRHMVGGERFRDIRRIIEAKLCDCDNLAAWRCAEIRNAGVVGAKPYITWRKRPDGGTTYHALVWWPDDTTEDPSLILGMGGEEKVKERKEELRKNAERAEMIAGAFQKASQKKAATVAAAGMLVDKLVDEVAEELFGGAVAA